jgi:DNA-binding GntR family transcriptional regulator
MAIVNQPSTGIQHVELVDRVYSSVKQMIFDQELKPGEKILQEKLSAQLGVSRSPLLKALQRLESEMLVQSIPRRGVYVKQLDIQEITDVFQCRAVLEGLSARLAAERVTPADIDYLRSLFAPFSESEPIDVEEYARADREFHDTIMHIGGNSVIARLELLSNIHLQAFQVGLLRPPVETLSEHRAIVDALAAHDGAAAEAQIRAHIDNSARRIKTLFLNRNR